MSMGAQTSFLSLSGVTVFRFMLDKPQVFGLVVEEHHDCLGNLSERFPPVHPGHLSCAPPEGQGGSLFCLMHRTDDIPVFQASASTETELVTV